MSNLFSKPKAPQTPNYADLARQQGEENRRSAEQTALLGSPNEVTPWGSINRAYDQDSGQFTYTTQLTPDQQGIFDQSQNIDRSRVNLGNELMTDVAGQFGQPFDTSNMTDRITSVEPSNLRTSVDGVDYNTAAGDVPGYQQALDLSQLGDRPQLDFSGLPTMPGVEDFSKDRQRVEDALYQQHTSRLDPQFEQDQRDLRNLLYSQGVQEGTEAWTRAHDDLYRRREDAYGGARTSAITGAGQEQSRLFGMASSARGQMANEALAASGFELDARSQGVSEALTQGDFANAVTQLERNYGLDRMAAENMARQLQNQLELATAEFENASARRGFDERTQNAVLANQSRGAEMDEAAYLRSLPFNEMQALLSGTEVTPPNFSGPTVAPGVEGAPLYQAGQDEYTAEYNRYAQEMSNLNALWGAIGSVGGAVGGAAMMRPGG